MFLSGRASTCHSAHSWWQYNGDPVEDQAASTMTWYLTESRYPDTEQTSICPIQLMPSAQLGSDQYQFCKSLDGLTQLGFELCMGILALYWLGQCVQWEIRYTIGNGTKYRIYWLGLSSWLELYVMPLSAVISGLVQTCDSAHCFSVAAPLIYRAGANMP